MKGWKQNSDTCWTRLFDGLRVLAKDGNLEDWWVEPPRVRTAKWQGHNPSAHRAMMAADLTYPPYDVAALIEEGRESMRLLGIQMEKLRDAGLDASIAFERLSTALQHAVPDHEALADEADDDSSSLADGTGVP